MVLPLFEEHDGVAAIGQLPADDTAARPRPHDDDVALEVALGPGVRAMHLLEPARLLERRHDVELAAHRFVDVVPVEVDELVDEPEQIEGRLEHRVRLPADDELLLLA